MAIDPFVPEAWTWFSITITVIVARYVSRFLLLKSIRKMTWEDFVMAIVALLYIAEINLLIKAKFTPTNLIDHSSHPPPDLNDPAEVALRVWGSKLIVAHETNFTTLIWVTKASLLLYYAKLTLPGSYRWTKITAIYVGVSYVVMEILYFGYWCRPFHDYWSVPVTNPQCATAENHLILNFAFNVSSDFMIMAIPIPLLIRTKLPLRQKLALIVAFSLGVFVITSAVLSRYHSFANLSDSGWVYWFAREASTAVIVANSPHLWALMRRVFNMESFVHHTPRSNQSAPAPGRFYQDIQDPLSARQPANKESNGSGDRSTDTYDIEKVLADAERECHMDTGLSSTGTSHQDSLSQTKADERRRAPSPPAPVHLHRELPSLLFEHDVPHEWQTSLNSRRAEPIEDENTRAWRPRSSPGIRPSLQ